MRGNTPRIELTISNEESLVKLIDRDSYCISKSKELRLGVEFARDKVYYSWELVIDKATTTIGNGNLIDIKLCNYIDSNLDENRILEFALRCREIDGCKSSYVGCYKGVILPNEIISRLKDGKIDAFNDWILEDFAGSDVERISDRIEGIRRIKIKDPKGKECEIYLPDTELKWWFEEGNHTYRSMPEKPVLHSRLDTNVEEFLVDAMEHKYLCLPRDITPANGNEWYLSSYWRKPITDLTDTSDYVYNPERKFSSYKIEEVNIFKYEFKPREVRFCCNKNKKLGVFVPENDVSEYEVIAFTDQSCESLVLGRVIKEIKNVDCFIEIEREWVNFCDEYKNRDVLLAIIKRDLLTKPNIWSTIGVDYIHQMMVELYSKDNGVVYTGDQLLIKGLIKDDGVNVDNRNRFDENHPIRSMYLYNTSQDRTYEDVRKAWENPVNTLVNANCKDVETWGKLFKEWLDSGFDPIAEGVAQEIYSKAKKVFGMISFPSPFVDIDQSSNAWDTLRRDAFNGKLRFRNGNLDLNDTRINNIWPQGRRRTENQMQIFRSAISQWFREWSEFEKTLERILGRFKPNRNLLQALGQSVNRRYIVDDNWLLREICRIAEFNNNVSQEEVSLNILSSSPREFYDTLIAQHEQNCAVRIFRGILERMKEQRMVANLPSQQATDREWLLFFAMLAVLNIKANTQEEDVRNSIAEMLGKARRNEGLWDKLVEYQGKCWSIYEICNNL